MLRTSISTVLQTCLIKLFGLNGTPREQSNGQVTQTDGESNGFLGINGFQWIIVTIGSLVYVFEERALGRIPIHLTSTRDIDKALGGS